MSKVKLDLNDFKHVSSDDKTTKLRHKHGHFLVLAHKALGPDAQKQLGALSKVAIESATPSQSNEMNDQKMADGGDVQQDQKQAKKPKEKPAPMPDPNSPQTKSAVNWEKGGGGWWAEGGKVEESAIQQAIRELPGDAKHAFSPEGLSSTYDTMKRAVTNTSMEDLNKSAPQLDKGMARGGPVQRYAEGTREPLKSPEAYASQYKEAGDSYGGGQDYSNEADPPAPQERMPAPPVEADGANNMPAAEPNRLLASNSPVSGNPPAQNVPEVPTDRAAIQKLYNSLVSGNPNNSSMQINTRPWATFGPNGEPPKAFDASTWQQAEQQIEKMKADAAGASQEKIGQIQQDNEVRMRAGLPPIDMPGAGQPVEPRQPPASIPQAASTVAQTQPQGMDSSLNNTEDMLSRGYKEKQAGVQMEQQAQQQLGDPKALAAEQAVKAKEDSQIAYKQTYDALDAERKNHIQDIQNGYIDPDKYWQNHSKLAAGIGMILAGFNPAGGENAAVSFLKHQMNMNLEAQRNNLGAKQNLLAANLRQFGNLRDATDMTKLMQNDLMVTQLQHAAAKAQTPASQAAALKAAGQIDMESAPLFQQFAMRRAMMGFANNGGDPQGIDHMLSYMRVMNPEMAKEMESRYIPGVGLATVPVPPDIRGQLTAHQQLDNAAKDLYQWASTHTTIVPGTPEYNVGAQKAQALQQLYRHGALHTVYREGEQPLLDKVVNGNPAGFLKYFSSMPKLKEVISQNERQSNILKQNYGLKPTASAIHPNEGKIAEDAKGNRLIMQNGRWVPYSGR